MPDRRPDPGSDRPERTVAVWVDLASTGCWGHPPARISRRWASVDWCCSARPRTARKCSSAGRGQRWGRWPRSAPSSGRPSSRNSPAGQRLTASPAPGPSRAAQLPPGAPAARWPHPSGYRLLGGQGGGMHLDVRADASLVKRFHARQLVKVHPTGPIRSPTLPPSSVYGDSDDSDNASANTPNCATQ